MGFYEILYLGGDIGVCSGVNISYEITPGLDDGYELGMK